MDDSWFDLWPVALGATAALLFLRVFQLEVTRARRGTSFGPVWIVVLLVAQAAILSLWEAGPRVGYHHLRLVGSREAVVAWGVVALWSALVAYGLLRRRAALAASARRLATNRGYALLIALFLLAAAKLSRPLERSVVEFAVALALEIVALGNLWLCASATSSGTLAWLEQRFERLFGPDRGDAPEPGGPDRFAWLLALASVFVAALLNVFVYERSPHVPDEVVYLFHARYLAAGELFLAPPPVPAGFDVDLMLLDQGRWYSPVPPGWPLVLALGAWCGAPWLVNPLLGGATLLAAYALLRELTSQRVARIALVLLAVSPWFVFLNMSFMTHPLTLLAATCAALGVARARRTGSIGACALAGVAIGVAALVRPFDGLLLALLLGLWSIGLGGARLRWPAIAALVLSTAASGLAALPYNRALTGEPLRFPIQRYVDVVYGPGKNDMGFGPEKGLGWGGLDPWPGHSLGEGIVTAQFNLFSVNAELFGWICGSLVLVWIWLVCARWSATDRAMACAIAVVTGSSLLYWFNGGPDFGARYWHLTILPLVWASVRGLRELERRAAEPARVRAGVVVLVTLTLFAWIPWRALDKYRGYRGMQGAAHEALADAELGRELVLVAGPRHPDYAEFAWLNPTRWDADEPVFAWARDAQTTLELFAAFADRPLRVAQRASPGAPIELSPVMSAREAWEQLARDDVAWRAAAPKFDILGAFVRSSDAR